MKTLLLASLLACVACASPVENKLPPPAPAQALSIERCTSGGAYTTTCTYVAGTRFATAEVCSHFYMRAGDCPAAPLGCCTPYVLKAGLYDAYTCFYPIPGVNTGSTEASARATCDGTWSAVMP